MCTKEKKGRDDGVIEGNCLTMCPAEEMDLRERLGLLHPYEVLEQSSEHSTKVKKSDPERTIKAFTRSAAGTMACDTKLLRPAPVLLRTVKYLVEEIVPRFTHDPAKTYDFVTDRFRAVRQDMTIQRLPPDECISLLEPMVRFHLLFGYMQAKLDSEFDLFLNDSFLNECLIRVMECYRHASETSCRNRNEIESYFCYLNLNDPETVMRTIHFEAKSLTLDLIVGWTRNNYWRVVNLLGKLGILACTAVYRNIGRFRINGLKTLCVAMSSPNSAYPADRIALLLSYNSVGDVFIDCEKLGIRHDKEKCFFFKRDLKEPKSNERKANTWFMIHDPVSVEISRILVGPS